MQPRERYAELLKRWQDDWVARGQPTELASPTLKSYIANGNQFSELTLLAGKIPNLQTILECSAGDEGAGRTLSKSESHTILEVACGLTEDDVPAQLLAQVAAYASEQTRGEVVAVAISTYFLAFTSNDDEDQFSVATPDEENFETLKNYLTFLVGARAERFLYPLIKASLSGCKIKHGGKGLQMLACLDFWSHYCSWRHHIISNSKRKKTPRLLQPDVLEEVIGDEPDSPVSDDGEFSYEPDSPDSDDGEFSYETALIMVKIFVWLDESKFARFVSADDKNVVRVRHKPTSQKNGHDSVIQISSFSSGHRQKQIEEAVSIAERVGVTKPVTGRDLILHLHLNLRSEFGEEGAKRFTELSHIAFHQEFQESDDTYYQEWAMFWANFRTFIDVEKATQMGHPFNIEHFTDDIFFINDSKGARVSHSGGAGMSMSALRQMARPRRDDF